MNSKLVHRPLYLNSKIWILARRWPVHKAAEEKEAWESLRPVTDPIPDSPQSLGVLKISRALTAKFLTKKLDWIITTLSLSRSDRQEYLHCLAIFSKCSEKYYEMTELSRYSSPLIEDVRVFKTSKPKAQWKRDFMF